MTQVIFPKNVQTDYFIYNSLYHNSSGTEINIYLVVCTFKQLGKFQKMMSWLKKLLKKLMDNFCVNWRCTCGCISRPNLTISASLHDIMGKSKEISQDLRIKCVDLDKSGSS
jgi:hypothetical protein